VAVRDVMFATSAERRDPLLGARASRVLVVVMTPICLAAVLAAPVAVPLLFGRSFEGSVPVAQLLFLAALPGGVDVVLGAGLMAAGRPGARSLVQVAAAALLVVGLVVLVPPHGATGGALAVLLARAAGAAMTVAATVRMTGLSPWECFAPTRADVRDVLERARRVARRGRDY
jgi:O-antigen/teichoic acid export membrane protein